MLHLDGSFGPIVSLPLPIGNLLRNDLMVLTYIHPRHILYQNTIYVLYFGM